MPGKRKGSGNVQTTLLKWHPQHGWSDDPSNIDTRPGGSFALAFADSRTDVSAVLAQLRADLGGIDVVACSGAGQILGHDLDPAPLVAAVVTFDTATVRTVHMNRDRHSEEIGAAIGEQLAGPADGEPIKGALVFGGGLDINGQALVAGIGQTLPAGTALSGGLAADDDRFETTWVYCNGETGPSLVAAVGVYGGSVTFRNGSQGGWDGFGPRRTITRSDGNVLYELDGQPALALYKQYLGKRAAELPASALLFPLSVVSPEGGTEMVRTVLAIDEDAQSMTFAGSVPQGWFGRLMWTTKDDLLDGAAEAGALGAQPDAGLAVAVSCIGRRLVLDSRSDEEIDCILEEIGEQTPLIGFYSYGEITPIEGVYSLQNQTMTVTTIGETRPKAGP